MTAIPFPSARPEPTPSGGKIDSPFPVSTARPGLSPFRKLGFAASAGSAPVQWRIREGLLPYDEAVAEMERTVAGIAGGAAPETVWLVEHPPLYTAGTSARDADLVEARFPVHRSGRGGQLTYHGPGQRVAYVMLDLTRRRHDIRAFVAALEDWLIEALARVEIRAERREDRVGVWVGRPDKPAGPGGAAAEDKIAAIGIRLRRWISYHGVAINIEPDLGHFAGIVPCGIAARHYGVTSLSDLGHPIGMAQFDAALRLAFEDVFGPTVAAAGHPTS